MQIHQFCSWNAKHSALGMCEELLLHLASVRIDITQVTEEDVWEEVNQAWHSAVGYPPDHWKKNFADMVLTEWWILFELMVKCEVGVGVDIGCIAMYKEIQLTIELWLKIQQK